MKALKIVALVVVLSALVIAVFGIAFFILMLLWNAVVPAVFGGPAITYTQAFLLYLFLWFVGGFFRGSPSAKLPLKRE